MAKSINELRFGLQGMSFLEKVADRPERTVELAGAPARHLLVWDSNDIAEVFHAERDMRLEESDTLRPLVGGTSLLFANGPRHAAYRRTVGPALRGRRLDGHRPAIADIAERAADELAGVDSFVVPAWTRSVTLQVIGHILLADPASDLLTRLSDLVERTLGPRPAPCATGTFTRPP